MNILIYCSFWGGSGSYRNNSRVHGKNVWSRRGIHNSGSVKLLDSTPYLRQKQVRVRVAVDPSIEHLILTWLVEYKMRITDKSYRKVLDTWESEYPQAVEDGKKLFDSGALDLLRQDRTPARDFFHRLETLVASI